jgi:hypothetical protein
MGFPEFSAGAPAEEYDIQAQDLEVTGSSPSYSSYVSDGTTDANGANSATVVISGISTQPAGKSVTAAEIETAVTSSSSTVWGYWFNIPDSNFSLADTVLTDLQNDGY